MKMLTHVMMSIFFESVVKTCHDGRTCKWLCM